MSNKRFYSWLAFFIMLAAFLRFYNLGFQSLWRDELFTYDLTRMSWSEMWRVILVEETTNPPLYWIMEWISAKVVPDSEFGLRFLTALLGVLSVVFASRIWKVNNSKSFALIYAGLLATSFPSIELSQEARAYSPGIMFSVLAIVLWLKVFMYSTAGRRALIGLLAVNLALSYTHYFGTLMVFVFGITALYFTKTKSQLKTWALVYIGTALGFLPWIFSVMKAGSKESFWIKPPDFWSLLNYPKAFTGGSSALGIFWILLLIGFLYQWRKNDFKLRQLFLLSSSWWVGLYLLAFALSYAVIPMLTSRYMMIALPAFLLALTAMFESIRNLKWKWGLFTLWSLIAVGHVFWSGIYTVPMKTDIKGVFQTINRWAEHNTELTDVAVCCLHTRRYDFYFRKLSPQFQVQRNICSPEEIGSFLREKSSEKVFVDGCVDKKMSTEEFDAILSQFGFQAVSIFSSVETRAWHIKKAE